jgi:hypothetical protein
VAGHGARIGTDFDTLPNDRKLGGRAMLTWNSLSNACHHRVYELPPTASELNMALENVWDLADAVERLRGKIKA